MKKLIFTAAAVAGMGAFALESANVVGYADTALRSGNIAVGSQFVPVTGEVIDLCDIIPTGYGEDYEGGSIYVQSLDASGKMVAGSKYFWYDDEDGTGWFDGNDELVVRGQVTYKPGEGLWVKANAESESLQTSGQVAKGGFIDVALRAGNKLVSNPTPVAIPFNDDNSDGKFIAPSGYGADYEGGSIYVQKLNASGKMVEGSKYFWYDDEDGTAWFDGNDDEVEGAVLNPGEAIWVKANSTAEKFSIPTAL